MLSLKLFTLLLAVAASLLAAKQEILNGEEARNTITNYLSSLKSSYSASQLCVQNSCCNVTSTETCSISSFPKDQSTLVLPGGQTRCIYSYSTPFAFQVIPGDSDKLLFYFQGGGACWDKTSTDNPLCTTDVAPQSLIGVFDRKNVNNRFKSFTIVHVLYCSGDVHGGNTTRPYNDKSGVPIKQLGLENGRSALNWVQSQVRTGKLPAKFSELVVMGCSAGSLGAQLWGKEVLTTLRWSTAAVIPDSYAGVFPVGSVGPLMYGYGFCSSGFLSATMYKKCMDQELSLEDVNIEFASVTPSVPYAFMQSKVDAVQQSFYVSVALSMNSTVKTITPAQFYTDVNDIFGLYNNQLPNFVTYLINGDHHCFTPYDLYFTADPLGPSDNGQGTSSPLLYKWANEMPLAESETVSTICDGSVQGKLNGIADTTYCSSKVVPKTFTEHY
jgi:hypothetical protein